MTIASTELSSFSHVNNLIKAIFELKIDSSTIDKVVSIQTEMASVQVGYLALIQQNSSLVTEKDDLKKEISNLKDWNKEKERYELKDVDPEVFAYVIKDSAKGTEPVHWLCCHCYNQGKKEIVILFHNSNYHKTYICHGCSQKISVENPN